MNIIKFLLISLLAMSSAIAAPGAHGPNGEHLDAPGGHVHADAGPRMETFTESFELVGRLQGGELSVLIDRYETNEPVLNGNLEVEFNGMKAIARFHADHGDYAVSDENFLKALAKPGKHALLFTLNAGKDNDLLEGTLEVTAAESAHGHSHENGHSYSLRTLTIGGALLISGIAIALAVFIIRMRRRKTSTGK
jgi:hypothetical protein